MIHENKNFTSILHEELAIIIHIERELDHYIKIIYLWPSLFVLIVYFHHSDWYLLLINNKTPQNAYHFNKKLNLLIRNTYIINQTSNYKRIIYLL